MNGTAVKRQDGFNTRRFQFYFLDKAESTQCNQVEPVGAGHRGIRNRALPSGHFVVFHAMFNLTHVTSQCIILYL